MLRQVPYERIEGLFGPRQNLDDAMALARRNLYGANNILDAPVAGWRELLLDTLRDPMLWFLIVTASLFAVIGEIKEAVILTAAILPLAGMDMFLHRRTQASTASLGGRLAAQTTVIRNNHPVIIPGYNVVCGDLVIVNANESFPADGIVVEAQDVQVDESALTGEAFPVRKKAFEFSNEFNEPMDGRGVGIDTVYWGFAGTRLLAGTLRLRVVYTGNETYYGEIVRSALQGRHARTPLQVAIGNLVTVLLVAASVLCLTVAWVRWYQGFGLLDAVVSAMTLAIAALPEEFPVVFTFFLGVGVYRLAKRRALVRRAVAVENIGRVTTICSDKTGTLTLGKLTLTHSYPAAPHDEEDLLQKATLASRADSGDPMDESIVAACKATAKTASRVTTFPFTEGRKKETSILRLNNGQLLIVAKGAPEVIIRQCQLPEKDRTQYLGKADKLASEGHKVIACAQRIIYQAEWTDHEPDTGFEYLGLIALEDPVREGVIESVRLCQQAGIHVIMITGDHPLTARAVAAEIGLGGGNPRVVTAEEIETRSRSTKRTHLHEIDVIARSIPAQKLQFVRQLQADGEIVSVTGDGVNDVPALQAADIGIAMGERGTQAAREVSAVVLLDDNFRTIVRAIAEGYQLFQNLRMSFAYLLIVHIPLVISAAVIPLSGFPLLYLPIHIVWLELIIHPTALLVFQQLPASEIFTIKKRHGPARFFNRNEWFVIALAGTLLTGLVVGGYVYSLGIGRNVEHARAMALSILCLGSAFITASLSRLATRSARIIAVGSALSALFLVQIPALATLLHLQPLHLNDWLIAVFGSGLIAFLPHIMGFTRAPVA